MEEREEKKPPKKYLAPLPKKEGLWAGVTSVVLFSEKRKKKLGFRESPGGRIHVP